MQEKQPQSLYDKYPVLAVIVPIAGGIFAWYFSQSILLGLFVAVSGLIFNWMRKR